VAFGVTLKGQWLLAMRVLPVPPKIVAGKPAWLFDSKFHVESSLKIARRRRAIFRLESRKFVLVRRDPLAFKPIMRTAGFSSRPSQTLFRTAMDGSMSGIAIILYTIG